MQNIKNDPTTGVMLRMNIVHFEKHSQHKMNVMPI